MTTAISKTIKTTWTMRGSLALPEWMILKTSFKRPLTPSFLIKCCGFPGACWHLHFWYLFVVKYSHPGFPLVWFVVSLPDQIFETLLWLPRLPLHRRRHHRRRHRRDHHHHQHRDHRHLGLVWLHSPIKCLRLHSGVLASPFRCTGTGDGVGASWKLGSKKVLKKSTKTSTQKSTPKALKKVLKNGDGDGDAGVDDGAGAGDAHYALIYYIDPEKKHFFRLIIYARK